MAGPFFWVCQTQGMPGTPREGRPGTDGPPLAFSESACKPYSESYILQVNP